MPDDLVRRRRLGALGVLAALALVAGLATGAGGSDDEPPAAAGTDDPRLEDQPPRPQLPGGGRRLFPDRRVVAFYGSPVDDELGALGIGTPAQAARRLRRQARGYATRTRPVLPAFELIATLATAAPGADGKHRMHLPDGTIRRYLRAARKARALLVLDIQPGLAQFGPEIERLRRWLEEPDVGLALDPEWHVAPGEVPGKVIGRMDADAVNGAAAYLSKIVRERDLPEKLLLVHRFTDDMIVNDGRLRAFPGVRTVVNVDGFGGREVKVAKYQQFVRRTPRAGRGFKLFYKEDAGLMRPRSVMAMQPRPDVVVYE
ncbi:hypothetical protein [Conexibacter sp. SYSU D00693]|uniref:hypothetical protein n=1 Tax=Conexibacter sp. SYSU D00693 TaxID=2812560 RepID=UPI00196AFCAE|nr:hypothetical protein [Conexibacter sp. SYSU D00693]